MSVDAMSETTPAAAALASAAPTYDECDVGLLLVYFDVGTEATEDVFYGGLAGEVVGY